MTDSYKLVLVIRSVL